MKKVIKFSALFLPCAIFSTVVIATGIFGIVTRGINYGIDFQAGLIEQIRIAPTAFTLKYSGIQTVTVSQSSTGITFVQTGVSSDNQTYKFPYAQYPTVGEFAAALSAVADVSAEVACPADTALKSVFVNAEASTKLSADPYRFHYAPSGIETIEVAKVRAALAENFSDASVLATGKPAERAFQIRLADNGKDQNASLNLRTGLATALKAAFGEDNVAIISTDFVGSAFSKSLARQALILVAVTLLLILVYCMFRFRWDFAVGGVLAIAHDALIMITFIVWSRMQFNSLTIAAILTILGYSINDTVVIFDRIRENMRFNPDMNITDVLNQSQTDMLGRTIITTITTMLCVLSLVIFTTGDIHAFSIALLVGMTSGVYSTVYIASAFISFVSLFRKDHGKYVEKAKPAKAVTSGEVV